MTIDKDDLARYAPAVLGIVIAILGWAFVVRPVSSASDRDARTLSQLRMRVAQARRSLSQPVPPLEGVNPGDVFRREVRPRDASPELMEQLARLASATGVSNLMVETGERVVVPPASSPSGPRVAGASQPDPRLALFDASLSYVPITMAFDSDYARLGDLLWRVRDVPTLIEVRSVEIKAVDDRAAGTVHATLTLFAYGRQESGAAGPAVVRASNGPQVAP